MFFYIKNKIISSINTANDSLRNALISWLQDSTLSTIDSSNNYPINSTALNRTISDYVLKSDIYYEDIIIKNPSWVQIDNVYMAGNIKEFDSTIRDKVISANVIYWTGFKPWVVFDYYDSVEEYMMLQLYSSNNTNGWCRVRIWYKE